VLLGQNRWIAVPGLEASPSWPWRPAGPDRNFTWHALTIARTMSASQCSAIIRAGRIQERDGKLYATSPAVKVPSGEPSASS